MRFFGPGDVPDREFNCMGERMPVFFHEERILLKGLRYVKFGYCSCPRPGSHVRDPDDSAFWGAFGMDRMLGSELRLGAGGGADRVTVSI